MDEREFESFVVARTPALLRTAYVLCGDQQLAEDLVQLSLARTAARLPKIREVAALEALVGHRIGPFRPPAAVPPPRIEGPDMLSITTKSPYALRALTELARLDAEGPVPIGELAKRRDIPVQFLEQLFATLRRAGLLRSQRGVKGGYSFARAPSEITVLDIVELLDGPLGADAEGVFSDAAAAARAVLSQQTLVRVPVMTIISAPRPARVCRRAPTGQEKAP